MNGSLASVTSQASAATRPATEIRFATHLRLNVHSAPRGKTPALITSLCARSAQARALLASVATSSLLCWACAKDTEAPSSDSATSGSTPTGDLAATSSDTGTSGTQSSPATSGATNAQGASGGVSVTAGSPSVTEPSGTISAPTSSAPTSSAAGAATDPGAQAGGAANASEPDDGAGSGVTNTDSVGGAGGNPGQAGTTPGAGGTSGAENDTAGAGGRAAASGGAASIGAGGAEGQAPEGSGALLDRDELVRIMPFGDSIVEAQQWRSLLASKLAAEGYANVEFVGSRGDHEGHGGLLVTDVSQANLSEWIAPNPADLVLFEIGTNDVWNGRDPSLILAAYELVMSAMRTANTEVIILVAQITPMSPDEGTCSNCTCSACMDRTIALNDAIAAWAPGFSTPQSPVIVVDQWTGFDVDADTSDRVHPNNSGAEKVAQNWYDAIAALY